MSKIRIINASKDENVCENCGKSFKLRQTMRHHFNQTCKKIKGCDVCKLNKKFNQKTLFYHKKRYCIPYDFKEIDLDSYLKGLRQAQKYLEKYLESHQKGAIKK